MPEKLRKRLLTLLKIVISGVLIYFIFTKINFKDVVETLKTGNPYYLIIGTLLVLVSKIIAAFRLNLYFHQIDVRITQKSNLKLYFLGMFYNLFLPGGIGGDAYKGYVIQKKFKSGTKRVVSVLLLDRLSGMLLIFIYICVLAILMNDELFRPFQILFYLAIPISVLTFWWVNNRFFGYTLPIFWKSLGYSAIIQLSQLVCVVFILKSFNVELQQMDYLLVFLISSIVSVIPLTIGGIGSREVTFLYGATWLGLNEEISVGVSFVFFLITALISFFGVIYHFKKPKLVVLQNQSK
ncbi:lysylphosphatidylglycerol synthase transmembrane domain-containing protein [Flagellimonas sp. S174]|uniref:lysylphosphatidylglycerol synthase transmembrane domain-containing protein n=1 Tax=Flagellimonas sp. S174 TaxID=3410790 RepID=UPI003BF47AC1